MQTTTTSKKYLWNYEKITYTNGTSVNTTPVIIGTHGATGPTGATGADGKDGRGVKSSAVKMCIRDSVYSRCNGQY